MWSNSYVEKNVSKYILSFKFPNFRQIQLFLSTWVNWTQKLVGGCRYIIFSVHASYMPLLGVRKEGPQEDIEDSSYKT